MKFRIERKRLRRLMSTSMMYDTNVAPSTTILRLNDDGIICHNVDANILGCYLSFDKRYFLDYDVSTGDDEFIPVPIVLKYYNTLKNNFRLSEIVVKIVDNEITFESSKTSINDTLRDKSPAPIRVRGKIIDDVFRPVTGNDDDYEPKKVINSVITNASEFAKIPDVEDYYRFKCNGKNIRIIAKKKLNFERTIDVDRAMELGEHEFGVAKDLFNRILNNVSGQIWLGTSPKALHISKTEPEYTKLFTLALKEVE